MFYSFIYHIDFNKGGLVHKCTECFPVTGSGYKQ